LLKLVEGKETPPQDKVELEKWKEHDENNENKYCMAA
jgi:hypothetical protein